MELLTQLSLRLDRLQLLHHAAVRRAMSNIGLWRGQPPILEFILDHEGCSQAQLAETLGISPASVAISTKRLCKAGLLEKVADPENLRCNMLRVTPLGRQKTIASQTALEEVNRTMFQGFSDAERDTLCDYLNRMIQNLGDDPGDLAPIENFILARKLHGKAK